MTTPPMLSRWAKRALALGIASLINACSSGNSPTDELPPAVTDRVALTSFQGGNACADLETYIEDNAVRQMRTELEAQRDGVPSWGWWWGGFRGGPELANDAAAGGLAPPSAPSNYTTTNTQVAGVDEADFVKNDGTRAFVLSGETFHTLTTWPANQTKLQGTLRIEGWPNEMFLAGANTAVVFSSIYTWYPLSNAAGADCASLNCGYYSSNTVKVTQIDVSDLAHPRVVKETYLPGHYNSSRRIDNSVRLVISDGFNFPPGFKWSPDYRQGLWEDKVALRNAYNAIIAENEALIRRQTLADWVPAGKVKQNGVTTLVPHACDAFSKVNAPTRLGQVSVVTLDLAADSINRTTILAEPGEIYASAKNLYVATRHWFWWPQPGQRDTTYFHKFDISQASAARYVASGKVDGHIVDQFSMDESASGHFRVVTTIDTRVPDQDPANWWGRIETTNRLSVFAENAGRLEVVGRSEDLATGERVQSSRIIGDKGFVVTFRQVDPLFTFDLSNPLQPRKLGELKVPGFSTYIHPMDANHLLTIGTYVPEPVNGQAQDWRARALQLAIFDVSDMTNPRQTFTQLVGTAYGWSEAQSEHKAFNYFPAKGLLAIPFSDWNSGVSGNDYWSSFTSDLRVYSVDATTGFTPRGSLSLSDMYAVERYSGWTYYWQPSVRRSIMADDFVYAISDSGLRVANVNSLNAPVASVRFQRYQE